MSAASPALARPPVVVDTDVLSYLFKGDTRVTLYQPHLTGHQPVISFMTIAELAFWAEERKWGQKTRERLNRFLAGYTAHYPDQALCGLWGTVMAAARRAGRPIGPSDAWVAATALLYDAPLITHNAAHFAGVPGLVLLSAPTT